MARHRFTVGAVTGGGSGLGRALCVELARRGAAVVASDIDEEGLEETARLVRAAGGRVETLRADVRVLEDMEAMEARAMDAFGALDFWANNAGVAVAGDVGEVELDDWAWQLDINIRGVVHGAHVATRRFRAQGHGSILNVASLAGLVSSPGMAPYNVSKSAVVALSRTMYSELRDHGVGVTVLCPGFFQTNIARSSRSTDPRAMKVAQKLMDRSKLSANDVARIALDHTAAGRLHCVPMVEGKVFWSLVRLAPEFFQRNFGALAKRVSSSR